MSTSNHLVVYAVQKFENQGEQASHWTRIGAMFPNSKEDER